MTGSTSVVQVRPAPSGGSAGESGAERRLGDGLPAGPGISGSLRLGSDEHRDLFCGLFIKTHVPYDVAAVEWPDLTGGEHQLLVRLPVWDEAVNTEHETALVVRAMADYEPDPVMAEAIGLQAFEEERHAALVAALVEHYGITVHPRKPAQVSDPRWAFIRSGWGESIDSFFAFGVYAMARDMAIVKPGLLAIFDTVMQEEARHIFFFENWRRFVRRGARSAPAVALVGLRDALAASFVMVDRLRLAVSSQRGDTEVDQNFLLAGASELGGMTVRRFVNTCLYENERRLAEFDDRLPRPQVVPRLARSLSRFLPDRPMAHETGR
jgi:hypothetical protein